MGTNYYAEQAAGEACSHCGRSDVAERLHIGKSSAGWCFSLHVIPERGLNSLEDWKEYLRQPNITIEDEYGRRHTLSELLDRITNRAQAVRSAPNAQFLRENNAVPGPSGLVRHKIDRYCIGHGEGTWDLLTGEFS
jgi:hypothetical protein